MKPKTVMLVVEFPGGKDGFHSISSAKEFLSSALHSEGVIRQPENYEYPWSNDTSTWHIRIKDFRKILSGLASGGFREKSTEEYAEDLDRISERLDKISKSMRGMEK